MARRPAIEQGSILAGRYRIERLLGRGGFAEVYLARHLEIDSLQVAIKVLHASHSQQGLILNRFKREASLLALLRNRHTVRLVDFGFTKRQIPFLVMEYVEGAPLDRLLRTHGALRETDACRMAIHVLKALAEAHAAGVVHRDLKPANIFLVEEPGEHHSVARVLDFGIAKVMGDPEGARTVKMPAALSNATATDLVFCTPLYAAPELLRGCPDFRTDLYSLGLVMAEMLDGAAPYVDRVCGFENSPHLDADPVPLGPRASQSALTEIIQRACSKELNQRYDTAVEMLADLEITYSRIKRPDFSEAPLDLGIPTAERPIPIAAAAVTRELESQFVAITGDKTSTSQLLSETIAVDPELFLPELSFAASAMSAQPMSSLAPNGPRTIKARGGGAMVSGLVAVAIVGFFGLIAISANNGGRSATRAPIAPRVEVSLTPRVEVPEALAAITPESILQLPADSRMIEPLAALLEFEPSPPESDAVYEAAQLVGEALGAAPSACIQLVANAHANVRVDGVEIAALVESDGTWVLPTGTAIPRHRPLTITLRGPGIALSQEISDHGPVDLTVDLESLRTEAAATSVDEPRPRRSRSRRNEESRVASSRSGSEGSSRGAQNGWDSTQRTSLLGPPVAPRTR
ncbi:MAG: serine/threonine protein kinase [Bradymonadia bacterium]